MHIRVDLQVRPDGAVRVGLSARRAPPAAVAALGPLLPHLQGPVAVVPVALRPPAAGAPAGRAAGAPGTPLWAARRALAARLTRPLVALDLETTGLDTARARIVQVGLAILTPAGELLQWGSLVQPWPPVRIPAASRRVHGIDEARLLRARAPRLRQLLPGLGALLRGCDLLGHNALSFDLPLLENEAWCTGWALPASGHRLDSQRLYRAAAAARGWPGGASLTAALNALCGRAQAEPHDAVDDATDALDVLACLQQREPDLRQAPARLAALSARLPPRYPPTHEASPEPDVDLWRRAAACGARLRDGGAGDGSSGGSRRRRRLA